MAGPREVARVVLPTPFGEFEARAFDCESGYVHVALVKGDLGDGGPSVLARLHSECLTGDALGSLRCDCGVQLRTALRLIAAEGRGVLVYLTGHEGRGIGLLNKLRAYAEQDAGADTLEANLRLGLPVDARGYGEAGAVLAALGVRSVRLMTNNPAKVTGLEAAGVAIAEVVPLTTAPHARNLAYLRTKRQRLGHLLPSADGEVADSPSAPDVDVDALLGHWEPPPDRPFVVLKYAQTLDGRIATGTGDSKWISGEAERRVSHGLRAACDAICVGVGTVLRDDPELTVRMVPGASPLRVVLDSTLRTPTGAKVLSGDAGTVLLTTDRSSPARRRARRALHAGVHVVPAGAHGVDLTAALAWLRRFGVRSLLVEGGSRVITSMLLSGVVDRLVVAMAPVIIGQGTEAVGELGITRVADGIRLANRRVHLVGDDLLVSWDVTPRDRSAAPCSIGSDGRGAW